MIKLVLVLILGGALLCYVLYLVFSKVQDSQYLQDVLLSLEQDPLRYRSSDGDCVYLHNKTFKVRYCPFSVSYGGDCVRITNLITHEENTIVFDRFSDDDIGIRLEVGRCRDSRRLNTLTDIRIAENILDEVESNLIEEQLTA